jgi:hypothetical protein
VQQSIRFIKKDKNKVNNLKELMISTDHPEIQIQLGNEQNSIRFVETHYLDLKVIIQN